jgi:hypothetical protein
MQSSETTDFSSKSSTAYLGLFQDNSDISILSDDSLSDNTNASIIVDKPSEVP